MGFFHFFFFLSAQVHSENRTLVTYKCARFNIICLTKSIKTKQRQIDGDLDVHAPTKYYAFLLRLFSIYLLLRLKCAVTFRQAFFQINKSKRKLGQKSLKTSRSHTKNSLPQETIFIYLFFT